jgi:hypothetical protein
MKKIITIALFISTFLIGCSSDSDSNQDSDFELGYMNFKLVNYFDFTDEEVFVGTQWSEFINNDGSVTHTINSTVQRVGNNPLFQQDFILVDFEFTVNSPLQINQIIQINNISLSFPLPYNNLNYDFLDFCSYLSLEKQNTTTGFVKITQIDNENGFLFGEFKFENLKNGNSGCSNSPSQQNFSIVDGSFKAYN